jgi:4-hydroxybutyrate CoA-transferase
VKFVAAEEAVSAIKSNDRVFVHSIAASPRHLIEAMVARASEMRNVEMVHLHTAGEASYAKPEYRDSFRTRRLFVAPNLRKAVAFGD